MNNKDDEYVQLSKTQAAFKELYEKILPHEIYQTLKKKLEHLTIKEESTNAHMIGCIEVEKFLEYCTNIYQRFQFNF